MLCMCVERTCIAENASHISCPVKIKYFLFSRTMLEHMSCVLCVSECVCFFRLKTCPGRGDDVRFSINLVMRDHFF